MLNVLIAEDNIQISVHLSNSINTKNVRCVGIINEGTKVYQKLKDLNPDVLILDLKMPGKNGLEILEKIQEDKKIKTKVFIYSGEMEYMALARKYTCIEKFFSKLTPAEEIAKELEDMVEEISNKNTGDKIIVEKYSDYTNISESFEIECELEYFCGFYSGENDNYFVFGASNSEESDDKEVLRVRREVK